VHDANHCTVTEVRIRFKDEKVTLQDNLPEHCRPLNSAGIHGTISFRRRSDFSTSHSPSSPRHCLPRLAAQTLDPVSLHKLDI